MRGAELTERVRAAHADAWEVEGRARKPYGGGVARLPGARLMASGLPQAQWNNGDVTNASVDVTAIRRWYEPRGVPWGLRVPVEIDLDFGEPLFVKRCVALLPGSERRRSPVSVDVRPEFDASTYADLEAAAFEYDVSVARAWLQPQFSHRAFQHWVATVNGIPGAIGTTIRTDGDAGAASYVTGLALLPQSPLEALQTLVDVATADAFASGAAFVHANPGTVEEDEIFAPHQPVEVPGFIVRVEGLRGA